MFPFDIYVLCCCLFFFFFFQAEDGIRDLTVTGVQTCALPIFNWPAPILTDSGGFQVFSLATIRKIQAHGVEFRSHLDGSLLFLGPKEAMGIQRELGSDIAMVFDDCPPHTSTPRELRAAVERTINWARECREQPRAPGQMVFGIVQGGTSPEAREECAKALVAL